MEKKDPEVFDYDGFKAAEKKHKFPPSNKLKYAQKSIMGATPALPPQKFYNFSE